jgi:mRNA-degrading endonuclease HigB of HigAB toxin-antitoxin module
MEWTQAAPGSIASSLPEDAEIVANLWYVIDHQGFIFSLRVLSYVATGTDQEKIAFLTSRAYLDYLVARPFPIPERYGTIFIGDNGEENK